MKSFSDAFDTLLAAVSSKRTQILGQARKREPLPAPSGAEPSLEAEVEETLARARRERWADRLWARDASLWTGQDEAKWLKWLDAGEGGCIDLVALKAFQAEVRQADFAHILLLGMGGSSLGPEVLAQTFGAQPGFPQLLVLDSTDADQIRRFEALIDPKSTLFVVSSKSGSTLEPDILQRHYLQARPQGAGAKPRPAASWPGAPTRAPSCEQLAQDRRLPPDLPRRSRHRWPLFGALQLRHGSRRRHGHGPRPAFFASDAMARWPGGLDVPPTANPGVELGCILGDGGQPGRAGQGLDPRPRRGFADLGAWLEQLIAESTGKQGKGLIPIDAEPVGAAGRLWPLTAGVFAYLRLEDHDEPALDDLDDGLAEAGHPLVWIDLRPRATAWARSSSAGRSPPPSPGRSDAAEPLRPAVDVEASKIKTRALTGPV